MMTEEQAELLRQEMQQIREQHVQLLQVVRGAVMEVYALSREMIEGERECMRTIGEMVGVPFPAKKMNEAMN
jgi:hypothetical protein